MRPFLTFLVFDGFCMHLHFTEFFDTIVGVGKKPVSANSRRRPP